MPASYFDIDGTLVSTNLIPPTMYYLLNLPTPVHVAKQLGRALLMAPAMIWGEMQDRRGGSPHERPRLGELRSPAALVPR